MNLLAGRSPDGISGRRRRGRAITLQIVLSGGAALLLECHGGVAEEFSLRVLLCVRDRRIMQSIQIRARWVKPDARDLGEAVLQIGVFAGDEPLANGGMLRYY